MDSPRELRVQAQHYRELARTIIDPRAVEAALELAAEYEALAAQLEAKAGDDEVGGDR
jgi:hypothetical protein